MLIKGSLHTDLLMHEVVQSQTGLRTERRLSHAFIMDVPTYHKPLVLTDCAINIYPTLEDKVSICQNAIDLAQTLGVALPKVADPLGGRDGQSEDHGHAGGRRPVQDGRPRPDHRRPRRRAAGDGQRDQQDRRGGQADRSEVAGDADILVVPDLEAGNMLAKQLTFMANADTAGVVLGARVPIVLTSRSDNVQSSPGLLRRRPPRGPRPAHGPSGRW